MAEDQWSELLEAGDKAGEVLEGYASAVLAALAKSDWPNM